MSSKPIKNLVHTTEYVNNQGETKKRYNTVGKLFYNEQYQTFSVKLDSIPLGSSDSPFDGWLQAYDIDENRQQNGGQAQQPPAQAAQYQQPPQQPQYAQQPQMQQQQYAQPQAVSANYNPPANRPPDNLPPIEDLDKPIDLSAIPF